MIKYIIRKENDILYYNNGEWVSKDKAEEFDYYDLQEGGLILWYKQKLVLMCIQI